MDMGAGLARRRGGSWRSFVRCRHASPLTALVSARHRGPMGFRHGPLAAAFTLFASRALAATGASPTFSLVAATYNSSQSANTVTVNMTSVADCPKPKTQPKTSI